MKSLTLATVVADDDAIKLAFKLSTCDAIKVSIATVDADTSYGGEDFDGAIGGNQIVPPRNLTVRTAANAGSYVDGSLVTFTGLDETGADLVESVTIVGTDGGDGYVTVGLFSQVTEIVVEAQADTDGALVFGVSPTTFRGDSLDGVIGDSVMTPARTVTVKTTAAAGSYILDSTVVVSGVDEIGHRVSETFTIGDEDGGETLVGLVGFSVITAIDPDDQVDDSAEFKIGVRDFILGSIPTELRFGAVGNIKLGYATGDTDTIATLIVGEHLPLRPKKIFSTSDTTTTSKVTLVF